MSGRAALRPPPVHDCGFAHRPGLGHATRACGEPVRSALRHPAVIMTRGLCLVAGDFCVGAAPCTFRPTRYRAFVQRSDASGKRRPTKGEWRVALFRWAPHAYAVWRERVVSPTESSNEAPHPCSIFVIPVRCAFFLGTGPRLHHGRHQQPLLPRAEGSVPSCVAFTHCKMRPRSAPC